MSDPQFEVDEPNDATDTMIRVLEVLVVPLPAEPVGVGARWAKATARHGDDGTDVTGSVTMTLLARDAQTATIKLETTNSGKLPLPGADAPKGAYLLRTATNSAQTVIRFDGVAAKSEGDGKLLATQKVPGRPDVTLSVSIAKSLTSK
jgi:hypothetical protein